ncbi:unnamed protein product [Effrenium voratum]|uniref:Copper transport protein n=1 Tax=Effrenium voratum TaxID=2562239 RepID=A0AA36NDX9_9DINO|nr:unnamed protein product [Effrenium voratum]
MVVSLNVLRERVALRDAALESGVLADLRQALLFGMQMMFAYFAMLLVMLYEPLIFSCLILGFGVSTFVVQRRKRKACRCPTRDLALDRSALLLH